MRHYFLGLSANYSRRERLAHVFAWGKEKDRRELKKFLEKKYDGEAMPTKNGRSALALALKTYFEPGDGIVVNGFTCYAVYEAVKAAGLVPIWADINKDDLNFDEKSLEAALVPVYLEKHKDSARAAQSVSEGHTEASAVPKGIIIQNSLSNPVDIAAIEKFSKKHRLVIIEDLAHSVGVKYSDGREAGTVGAATALSFGKDKSIDTISGGAVILRHPCKNKVEAPSKAPQISDVLRARFYPLFGAIAQWLSYIKLSGPWMRMLLKIRWVEKSADNKLDLECKISKFEAKLALKQLKAKKSSEKPLREFCLVQDRNELIKKLQKDGYYFGGFWYERPVSPERYYKKVHFPEEKCPVATEVSKTIINIPTYYSKKELVKAYKIIAEYLEEDGK